MKWSLGFALLMAACASYKYDYQPSTQSIISKSGVNIAMISIEDESGKPLATFSLRDNTQSQSFSLADFSPSKYECTYGYDFALQRRHTYRVSALPTGDRVRSPLTIVVDSIGSIRLR